MKQTLLMLALVAGFAVFICPAARAQEVTKAQVMDQEIELMRQDLRAKRKQVMATNMELSPAEAEKFWPVFDQYIQDQRKIYDVHYGLLKEYSDTMATLTEAQALSLTKRWADTDAAKAQLRLKYYPAFEKIIGAKRTARFCQLERLLTLMIDVQIASDVPLIKP